MSIRRDLEQRAQEAILKNIVENYKQKHTNWLKDPAIRKTIFNRTFFKPANALLIAGTILAAGCLPLLILPILALTSPLWLILGALGPLAIGLVVEAVFLILSFRDEEAHAAAVGQLFEHQVHFDPALLKNQALREKVDKAIEYWGLIDETINDTPEGVLRDRLEKTTREVTHWLQAVYNLADRVDRYRLNKVIERDLESVPQTIKNYEARLAKEDSPEVRRQLEQTIADKKRQLKTLQSLKDNMEKASYQLESTISSLGTIYSQLLLVGSKDDEGSRINRLREEISEQVYQLEDLTEAMDEVYQGAE